MCATEILSRDRETLRGGDAHQRSEAIGGVQLADPRRERGIVSDAPKKRKRRRDAFPGPPLPGHAGYRSVIIAVAR